MKKIDINEIRQAAAAGAEQLTKDGEMTAAAIVSVGPMLARIVNALEAIAEKPAQVLNITTSHAELVGGTVDEVNVPPSTGLPECRWVPVAERLPVQDGWYYTWDADREVTNEAYFDISKGWRRSATHWLSGVPEPPCR